MATTLAELYARKAKLELAYDAVLTGQKKGLRGKLLEYPPLDVISTELTKVNSQIAVKEQSTRQRHTYIKRVRV